MWIELTFPPLSEIVLVLRLYWFVSVCRRQFYLNVCESFLAGRLHVSDDRQLTAQIAALIGHVETRTNHAGCSRRAFTQPMYSDWLPTDTHTDQGDMSALVGTELAKLSGLSKASAEYRLIQMVDSLPMYGACFHRARNSAGSPVNIAATSTSLVFFSDCWKQLNRSGSRVQFSALIDFDDKFIFGFTHFTIGV